MLSAIHEEDFLGFSYGFRPNRSQHDALDAVIVGIQQVLRPARALLVGVSLGFRPWLHRLRDGLLRLVRRLHGYYNESDFSRVRASSATTPRLPDADRRCHPPAKPEASRFPCKELPHMLRVFDHAGLGGRSRYRAPHVAFRDFDHVGVRKYQAFAARWLAYALPCQRFADILADTDA